MVFKIRGMLPIRSIEILGALIPYNYYLLSHITKPSFLHSRLLAGAGFQGYKI